MKIKAQDDAGRSDCGAARRDDGPGVPGFAERGGVRGGEDGESGAFVPLKGGRFRRDERGESPTSPGAGVGAGENGDSRAQVPPRGSAAWGWRWIWLLAVVAWSGCAAPRSVAPSESSRALARTILADSTLTNVLERARALLRTGLTAGDGYGEVWIRDLNTFVELQLTSSDPRPVREALLLFLRFQGPGGDIVDGYIPEAKASVGYKYRRSSSAPGLLAHKNTVETDQESSLVQAFDTYVRVTGDRGILDEEVEGRRVRDRLGDAMRYLLRERFDAGFGLLWGATTMDWGDVQPEHEWGVELDDASHRAVDIYDNAMFLVALRALRRMDPDVDLSWPGPGGGEVEGRLRSSIRRHLWDGRRGKFVPHRYPGDSPFPVGFDEASLWYHGGTAVAIEAGLLSAREIRASLESMRENVRKAGADSIGLTVYPPYPEGFFKNPSMRPWSYQNGGDWCWFGGRMVQQLAANGMMAEAYAELLPMAARVVRHGGFYEWWTREGQPKGSGKFRGSAGVLGLAIVRLRAWAEAELER